MTVQDKSISVQPILTCLVQPQVTLNFYNHNQPAWLHRGLHGSLVLFDPFQHLGPRHRLSNIILTVRYRKAFNQWEIEIRIERLRLENRYRQEPKLKKINQQRGKIDREELEGNGKICLKYFVKLLKWLPFRFIATTASVGLPRSFLCNSSGWVDL